MIHSLTGGVIGYFDSNKYYPSSLIPIVHKSRADNIFCNNCKLSNIGQTKRPLIRIIADHRNYFRKQQLCKLFLYVNYSFISPILKLSTVHATLLNWKF